MTGYIDRRRSERQAGSGCTWARTARLQRRRKPGAGGARGLEARELKARMACRMESVQRPRA